MSGSWLEANAAKTLQQFQAKNLVALQGCKAKLSGVTGEGGPPRAVQQEQLERIKQQVELVLIERVSSILENSLGRSDLATILSTMLANDSSVIAILSTVEALRSLIARHPLRIQLGWDPNVGAEMAALRLTNAQWEVYQAQVQAQLVVVQQFKAAQEQELQRAMTGQIGRPSSPDTVGWRHARNYITTVKRRLASKPEIYHKFLKILLSYEKEPRETKEVLNDVSLLFANHADLLKDFKSFLPDTVRNDENESEFQAAMNKHRDDTLRLLKLSAVKGESCVPTNVMTDARNASLVAMKTVNLLIHGAGGKMLTKRDLKNLLAKAEQNATVLYTRGFHQMILARSPAQIDVSAKKVEDRAGARDLHQAATDSDDDDNPEESSNQDSEKETELSQLLSDKEKLEVYTRDTHQKFQEKYLAALQDCKATLKETHDKFEWSHTRLLARTAQVEASIALKDEQIKTAAAKDERILTLETTLERRDQERAMKDKDILAIVSTLRSKDQKITDLEDALRNSKPIDVVDLISDGRVDCTNESTDPPSKRPRMEHEEVHPKSFLQSIVRVKEERQAAVTALADVRDDLDIEKDTVTQQEIFLTAWMNKFDELADIARNAGVDGAVMKSIRDRSVS
jgi:hypothetical protein